MIDYSKFRKLRLEKNFSIKELANKTGISIGMISQIERGGANITLTTLYNLCNGLDISISSLFEDSEDTIKIMRKENRNKIIFSNSKANYEMVTPNAKDSNLEVILIELEPGQNDQQQINHTGEECGYVIQGTLTILLNDQEYTLEEGDGIYFKSSNLHRFMNKGNKTCISIWAMSK